MTIFEFVINEIRTSKKFIDKKYNWICIGTEGLIYLFESEPFLSMNNEDNSEIYWEDKSGNKGDFYIAVDIDVVNNFKKINGYRNKLKLSGGVSEAINLIQTEKNWKKFNHSIIKEKDGFQIKLIMANGDVLVKRFCDVFLSYDVLFYKYITDSSSENIFF